MARHGKLNKGILDRGRDMTINYKFNENQLIENLQEYVDRTYSSHYAQGKIQATEVIIDGGHGMGFCLGNVLKYAQRYGHKDGFNRQDLLKTLHYALIALYVHDEEEKVRKSKEPPHDAGLPVERIPIQGLGPITQQNISFKPWSR